MTDARRAGVRRLPDVGALLRRFAVGRGPDRVYRALAFGFLPAGVVFGVLATPGLVAQATRFPVWWNTTAFLVIVLPPVALGTVAFVAPVRVIRVLARTSIVSVLLVQASLPLVIDRPSSIPGAAWIDQLTVLPLVTGTIALPAAGATGIAFLGAGLTFVDRLVADSGPAVLDATQNALYVLLLSITFIALGVNSLAASRAADEAGADALRAATDAAVDAARDRERARINALVHDRVLAVLLTAARQIPGADSLEREDARRAIDGLQALLHDDLPTPPMTGEAIAWHLQAITTELAPEAAFGYEVVGELEVPGDAVEALAAATEEAVRNSLRHAGRANRAVHVQVGGGDVRVDVLDDGVGFDPSHVPPTRLGIAESIEARMRALETGSAVVVSEPGVGTRVRLVWRAP